MDIRNPRLLDYLDIPERGFTNYLSQGFEIEDLIKYEGYDDFYISCRCRSAKPAELLMSKKDTLFHTLKRNTITLSLIRLL
jgi:hypothetical protein